MGPPHQLDVQPCFVLKEPGSILLFLVVFIAQIKRLLDKVRVLCVQDDGLLLNLLHDVRIWSFGLREEAHLVRVAPAHVSLRVKHVVVEVPRDALARSLVARQIDVNLPLERLDWALLGPNGKVIAQHRQMILNVTLVVVLAQGINVRTHLQLLLQAGHQVRRRRHRGWQSHRKPNLLLRHKRKVRSLVVFKLVVRVDLSLGQGSERLWDNATSLLFAGVGRR